MISSVISYRVGTNTVTGLGDIVRSLSWSYHRKNERNGGVFIIIWMNSISSSNSSKRKSKPDKSVTWWRHQMETSALLSPHKRQWRRALVFSLTCAWTNGWVNNLGAGDLRLQRVHHYVIVMRTHDLYLLYPFFSNDVTHQQRWPGRALFWYKRPYHQYTNISFMDM